MATELKQSPELLVPNACWDKRYLVFAGDDHYPSAAYLDFIGGYDYPGIAIGAGRNAQTMGFAEMDADRWCQIIDTETGELIASSGYPFGGHITNGG